MIKTSENLLNTFFLVRVSQTPSKFGAASLPSGQNRFRRRPPSRLAADGRSVLQCQKTAQWLDDFGHQWIFGDSHMLHVEYLYLQDWDIYGVNVNKYAIHGAHGIAKWEVK